jgi:hypothetical protein
MMASQDKSNREKHKKIKVTTTRTDDHFVYGQRKAQTAEAEQQKVRVDAIANLSCSEDKPGKSARLKQHCET